MNRFRVVAPTRADLAGGTLDLWPLYCEVRGGKTINVALDLFATATFEVMPAVTFQMQIESFGNAKCSFEEPLLENQIAKLPTAVQFPAMVASEFLRQEPFLPEQMIRLKVEAQAPLRSGLGGSSTLCVAMVKGLSQIFRRFPGTDWQWQMLNWVKDVEAAFLRTPTGTQDYLAALFGGLNSFSFDLGKVQRESFSESTLEALNERMIILFSGEMHSSGLSNWELFKNAMEGNEGVLQGFRAIKRIAEELNGEMARPQVDWTALGKLLNEEWRVRKEVFKVQTKRLDELIEFLTSQKVLGSKVCGAAQGGSLIALVEPQHREAVIKACETRGIQVLKTRAVSTGVTLIPQT